MKPNSEPTLEDHLRLFGKVPELVAADRNVHSKENEQIAKQMGVKKGVLTQSWQEEHRTRGTRAAKVVQESEAVSGWD